jgi:hypothetical protein
VKLFDNKLNRLQIQKLLSELRSSGLIFLMENRDLKSSYWKLKPKIYLIKTSCLKADKHLF